MSEEVASKRLYQIVLLISIVMVVTIFIYNIYASLVYGVNVIGEPLVNLDGTPFEIPTPEIFPIYAKPVTWLYVAMLSGWFSFLELSKERAMRLSNYVLGLCKLIVFVVTLVSAYEILYNFSIWSALMSYQATIGEINPDSLINRDPNPQYPWNLVFATKLFTALTAVGAYTLFFIYKIDRIKEVNLSKK